MPKIIDDEGNLKEWLEWYTSFEDILKHERFFAYCNDETNVATIYDMIGILYKIEMDINKMVVYVKYIEDSKWNIFMNELNTIRGATWLDIKTNINIWEVVADIKAFPYGDSNWMS